MNIQYTDRVKQSEEFELVQKATAMLEEVLGSKNAPLMSGEWDRTDGETAPSAFMLRLHNPDGETAGRFNQNDLQNPSRRELLLRGLWSNLLGQRLDRLLHNLADEGGGNAA